MDFIFPQSLFPAMESQSFKLSRSTQTHLEEQDSNSGLFCLLLKPFTAPHSCHSISTSYLPPRTHHQLKPHPISHHCLFFPELCTSSFILEPSHTSLPYLYLYFYSPPYNMLHFISSRLLFPPVTLQFLSYVFTKQKHVRVYQKHALEFSQQHYS